MSHAQEEHSDFANQKETQPTNQLNRHYVLENIRTLLTGGFDELELRNLCTDTDMEGFGELQYKLPRNAGVADLAGQIIDYAQQKLLLDSLLTWAKEKNFKRYEKHQPYYDDHITVIGNQRNIPNTEIKIEQPVLSESVITPERQKQSNSRLSKHVFITLIVMIFVITIGVVFLWNRTSSDTAETSSPKVSPPLWAFIVVSSSTTLILDSGETITTTVGARLLLNLSNPSEDLSCHWTSSTGRINNPTACTNVSYQAPTIIGRDSIGLTVTGTQTKILSLIIVIQP